MWVTLLSGCSRPEDQLARHLRDGERFFENREFEKAKIAYVNAIRLENTNAIAIQRLAKIFFNQGQLREAFPLLLQAQELYPDDLKIREHLMVLYAGASRAPGPFGETNRTRLDAEIEFILQRNPTNEAAVLLLTHRAQSPEELTQAADRLRALRLQAGDHSVFHLAEAHRLQSVGDTNAAEAAFRHAIQMDPASATAHQMFAQFLFNLGRVQEAEASLRTAAEVSPPYGSAREDYGRFLISRGRLDEAKTVFDALNSQAPERIGAWVGRAEIALAERRLSDADRFLARALGQAPGDPLALRLHAQLRLAQEKPAEAIRSLERALQQQPNSAPAHFQMALALLLQKDSTRALQSLEQSVQIDPRFAPAVLLLAELNLNRSRPDLAVSSLRDILLLNPGIENAHLLYIRALRENRQIEDALQAAIAAQSAFPTNSAIALQLGIQYRFNNQLPEARTAFENAFRWSTTNSLPAFEQLVALDIDSGNASNALQRIEARLQEDPQSASVWQIKAQAHIILGEGEPAQAAFEKALAIDPQSRAALLGLAQLHVRARQEQQAIAKLEQLIANQPLDFSAQTLLGMLYGETQNHAKARQAYEAAIQIQPDAPLALNNLAYLLSKHSGELEVAHRHARRAHQLAPSEPTIADTLGWIEFLRGNYPESLRILSEISTQLEAAPEYQYHLGMAQYMMGLENPARSSLRKATTTDSPYPGIESAREHLAILELDSTSPNPTTLATLETRRRSHPTDIVALGRLAAAYENSGDFDKAREALDAAQKVNPKAPAILCRLAELEFRRFNNPSRALDLARAARAAAPSDPEVGLIAGQIAFQSGDQPWAFSVLQETSRQLNQRPDAAFALAYAAYSQGRVEDAVRLMNGVAAHPQIDPDRLAQAREFTYLISLAQSASPTTDPSAASRVQQTLQADPNHGPALFAYGVIAESRGDFAPARDAYDRLLTQFPDFSPAQRQLAVLLAEHTKDDARAFELGVRARQAFPRDDVLAAALGKVVSRRGDHRYAVQLLTEAARTRATDPTLHYQLGVSSMALRQPSQARTALESALRLDPNAAFATDAKERLEILNKGG
jgi:tetratricopeptide (TPR) repeat protein